MQKIIKLILLVSTFSMGSANAAFVDAYQLSNWTSTVNGGSIVTSSLFDTVIMTSSNDGLGKNGTAKSQDFTIQAVADGVVSFTWSYFSFDSRNNRDPFGYLLNGVFNPLTSGNNPVLSRITTFDVLAGDILGFRADSKDSLKGAAITTITGLNAPLPPAPIGTPSAVPVPAALWLMAVPVLGLLGVGRKKKA